MPFENRRIIFRWMARPLAGFFLAVGWFFSCPAAWATISNLQIVSVNPAAPVPGAPLTFVGSYCASYNTEPDDFFLAVESASTSIISCPSVNQQFLVDVNGVNRDENDPCGGNASCNQAGFPVTNVNT
ncbi:MAG TPA: hypothetical protein VFR02_00730, partial [bacterium]|nr:hypothetical protein [bacterium]